MPPIIHKATEPGIFRAFDERGNRGEGRQANATWREGTKRRDELLWAVQ